MRNITLGATYSVLCAVEHKTDAATGEHGDLLDLIALNRGLDRLRDALDEAQLSSSACHGPTLSAERAVAAGAARLARIRTPAVRHVAADRGHDRSVVSARTRHYGFALAAVHCAFIRAAITAPMTDSPTETWPALIAAVTDLDGRITGAHRTWLDPVRSRQGSRRHARDARWAISLGQRRAFRSWPRRHGRRRRHRDHARRFAACCRPCRWSPALSANHLAALLLPRTLRRLYVARDDDPAGDAVMAT